MQKWEYMHVYVGYKDFKIQSIDGEQKWGAILIGGFKGEKLSEFLPAAGLEGWELVTSTRTPKSNLDLFFKRPIEN